LVCCDGTAAEGTGRAAGAIGTPGDGSGSEFLRGAGPGFGDGFTGGISREGDSATGNEEEGGYNVDR